MIGRIQEALQLPGSPIPATIGVMLHEQQQRYITNTAEAIDRYMVIRLGRYAHELGLTQTIDWARKQDLLAEVAFDMIQRGEERIAADMMLARLSTILDRRGDPPEATVVLEECVAAGILLLAEDNVEFFRTSLRDFFAGHYLYQRGDLDDFCKAHLEDRKWGGAIVFAAGLRRENSQLLRDLSVRFANEVKQDRPLSNVHPESASDPDEHLYRGFVLGRILSNSESSDHEPKLNALHEVIRSAEDSLPELELALRDVFGASAHVLTLIATEQTVRTIVAVPWLRRQIRELLDLQGQSGERQHLLAALYVHLAFEDCFEVLAASMRETDRTRVLEARRLLLTVVGHRALSSSETIAFDAIHAELKKRIAGRRNELADLWKVRSPLLQVEVERVRRLQTQAQRRAGGVAVQPRGNESQAAEVPTLSSEG